MKETVTKNEHFLVSFFKSEVYIMITLITITIPVMVHTANLLLELSNVKSRWYAYFFAFGFDLAIFTFAVNGRSKAAGGLAVIVLFLNICYFNLDTFYNKYSPDLVKFCITIVLSTATAFILHSYVMFFNNLKNNKNLIEEMEFENNKLRDNIARLEGEKASILHQAKKDSDMLQERISSLQSVKDLKMEIEIESKKITFPYKCEKGCNQRFTNQEALDAAKLYCQICKLQDQTGIKTDSPTKQIENEKLVLA